MQLSASQKKGIIQLAVLLALLCCFIYVKQKEFKPEFNIALNEKEQCWIDNEKELYEENQLQKKVYTYYVNSLDDYKAYMIGMNLEEIDRYFSYKKEGSNIHTKEVFQEVTKMDLRKFDSIKTKLRFSSKKHFSKKTTYDNVRRKFDLNLISPKELRSLGLPNKISFRVVNYRKHLGGYKSMEELDKVYDITSEELKLLKSNVYLKK